MKNNALLDTNTNKNKYDVDKLNDKNIIQYQIQMQIGISSKNNKGSTE